jgi:hypothetical protein
MVERARRVRNHTRFIKLSYAQPSTKGRGSAAVKAGSHRLRVHNVISVTPFAFGSSLPEQRLSPRSSRTSRTVRFVHRLNDGGIIQPSASFSTYREGSCARGCGEGAKSCGPICAPPISPSSGSRAGTGISGMSSVDCHRRSNLTASRRPLSKAALHHSINRAGGQDESTYPPS